MIPITRSREFWWPTALDEITSPPSWMPAWVWDVFCLRRSGLTQKEAARRLGMSVGRVASADSKVRVGYLMHHSIGRATRPEHV